jgi:hypothetical protein
MKNQTEQLIIQEQPHTLELSLVAKSPPTPPWTHHHICPNGLAEQAVVMQWLRCNHHSQPHLGKVLHQAITTRQQIEATHYLRRASIAESINKSLDMATQTYLAIMEAWSYHHGLEFIGAAQVSREMANGLLPSVIEFWFTILAISASGITMAGQGIFVYCSTS